MSHLYSFRSFLLKVCKVRIHSKAKKGLRDVPKRGHRLGARRLVCERLESRQLMAADMLDHNFVMPEDTDSSGFVSPLDALVVINALNTRAKTTPIAAAVDVDADGALTPLDALFVINFLNRSANSGLGKMSAVDAERRILRIEQAIETQNLPSSMELGTALHLLAVLQAGGQPEVGDRMLNGQLTSGRGVSDEEMINEEEIARYVSDYRLGVGSPSMDSQQVSIFADTLNSRLQAIGVDREVRLAVVQDVQSYEGLSLQNVLDDVKARLAELDIDVAAALPERMDVQFRGIVDQLQAAGVNEEDINKITSNFIDTIMLETESSLGNGGPLTLAELVSRFRGLGFEIDFTLPERLPF
jgi:hypothetical protein